ncbi:MFS transporter [Stygiolobus caldivivus]|uniref:MFS transporter n=1 Tax=Stygiolobus caldivivus TaxID=2824673 RepID=A0A8D5U649_9CREN|nr:MFS transporter [Stygiolobus caldivivus]BCU70300.1 MFS transporter [Stygiolobus caldivivus]
MPSNYVHSTIASTLAWAGNIYDLLLLTYVYSFLEKEYGIDFFEFTILFALGLIGRVIGGTYFGKIADKIGRKPVLAIGTAGYSLFQLLLAFAPDVEVLYASRLLEGIFMGAQWTAGTVLAYENAPYNLKGIVTGIVQSGYGIGYAFTGITYIFLGSDPRLFLVTGSLPLILVPYMKLINESKVSAHTAHFGIRLKDYLPILLKATAGMVGMFLAYFAVFGNYTVIANEYLDLKPYTLGILMTVANLGLALSFILFGRLADRFDKKKLIYIGVAGLLLSLPLAVPLLRLPPILPMAGVVIYAFSTGFWPLMPLLLADAVPTEVRGFLSGFAYNIGGMVGGFGNIILGIIEQFFGVDSLVKAIDITGLFAISVVLVSVITWPKSKGNVVLLE